MHTVNGQDTITKPHDPNNNPDNPIVSPKDTITNFLVYFTNPENSTVEVGAYEDPDGSGPAKASIGGVTLKANTLYIVNFLIEDGSTNNTEKTDINSKIISNGTDYKMCISNPLGISVTPTDYDSNDMILGLQNELMTSSKTGSGSINFTLRYQKGVKNGQCEVGTNFYSCNIPITIN